MINFIKHFIWGIRYGYPPCCVLEFCIRNAKGQAVAAQVGCWYNPECKSGFVHCFLHRKQSHKPQSLGFYLRRVKYPHFRVLNSATNQWQEMWNDYREFDLD